MRSFTLVPLFGLGALSSLLTTEMPHLLVPLRYDAPNTAQNTQLTGEVSNTVYTEVSFDMPGNIDARICRTGFEINTSPVKNAPRELKGDAPFQFNIWRLTSPIDKANDTWVRHATIGELVATVTITPDGAVSVNGGWFKCPPKWSIAEFILRPVGTRALKYWWFELDYPEADGGKHGITMEMYS
jgi:hypothetical protein